MNGSVTESSMASDAACPVFDARSSLRFGCQSCENRPRRVSGYHGVRLSADGWGILSENRDAPSATLGASRRAPRVSLLAGGAFLAGVELWVDEGGASLVGFGVKEVVLGVFGATWVLLSGGFGVSSVDVGVYCLINDAILDEHCANPSE